MHDNSSSDRGAEWRTLLRETILRTAMDGFWMVDLEGRLLEVNDAYCRMSGYPEEELLRMRISDLEVLETSDETARRIAALREAGAQRFESRHRRKDGSVFDVEVSVQHYAAEGGRLIGFLRDITDRKRAEQKLLENQEMFSQFMLHSPIYAYIKNVKPGVSRVIQASENYIDMLGIPGSAMAGKSMQELFPAEFAEKMTEDDNSVVRNGEVLHLLEEFNGRYYTTIKFPIDLHGEKLLAGYTIDITDQKLAELALQEKENTLLESQAVANLGSYVWDITTGMWESSRVLDRIFGINDSFVRDLEGWTGIIHPEWRESMQRYVTEEVLGRGQMFDREYRIVNRESREERWVHGKGRLEFDSGGRPVRMIGTIADITDRKLAEERIHVLSAGIQQSPAMVLITDPEGTIEYVNARFSEITGFSSEEAIGNNPRILKSGDASPEDYARLWKHIKSGKDWQGEFRNRKKNGELYWESALISPIVNEVGRITHFIAIKEDITKRKQAEIELRQAKDHAERMGKVKDAFIANISHEIRTPLNTIVGFTGLVEERFLEELTQEEQEYFTSIRFATQRLMRTVDLILGLSRVQAGDVHLEPQTFELSAHVQQLCDSFQVIARRKGLEIVFRNDLGEIQITTDRYSFTEAVSNLVNNAIKFTEHGGVTLHLSRPADGKIVLDVIDTGIGISDDYKPQLFEPYSQEDSGYSRRFEGIGLGMTLVKKYLDLLHLPITFESVKHQGTRFSIDLSSVVSTGEAMPPDSNR